MRICLLASLVMLPMAALAGDIDNSFFSATYNFNPHELSSEEIDKKSADLDVLWKKVTEGPGHYIAPLRTALVSEGFPPYFYYDGGQLLLNISDSNDDKKLTLSVLTKVDLKDIQNTSYLYTVHRLAVEGLDTTDAALHILGHEDFKAFIPQHVLTLGQNYSFIYMLMPLNETTYIDRLITKLNNIDSPVASKTLILAIWYSVTNEGNRALEDYAQNNSRPDDLRDYAKDLIARSKEASSGFSLSSEKSLRKERREVMGRISDEALHELDALTKTLIKKLN